MHLEIPSFGDRRDRADLRNGVDRADFRRLRQRDDLRLRIMDVGAAGDELLDRVGRELAVPALRREQLRAAREELRAAAFVGLDMRQLVADHGVIRLAQRRQRERVGRRAVEHEEDFAVGLEQVADAVADLRGPRVVAIGGLVAARVGLDQRPQRFRADARVVVGSEMLGRVRGRCHEIAVMAVMNRCATTSRHGDVVRRAVQPF
jgi:hypothetical protein